MDVTCTVWTDEAGTLCGAVAVAVAEGMCVHEHGNREYMCTTDAAKWSQPGSCVSCRYCLEGPEPHDCRVSVEFTPLVPALHEQGAF